MLNKKIFVIGGWDFKGERVLDFIECFDILGGEWSLLMFVLILREGFCCVMCRVSCDYFILLKFKWFVVLINIL